MAKDAVEPERSDQDKCGKDLLDVYVCEEEKIKGKMGPGRIALESSLSGTSPEAPEQPRLLLRDMQRTTVDMSTAADGSLEQEEIIHLQVVVGVKPDNQTSPIATSCKIVIFPMSWQQGKMVELDNEQNKQFDPGG